MGSLTPGHIPKLHTELSEMQKDTLRSKLVEIVSGTANNCLAELGYYPGIKQNIAILEKRCDSWQEENVKLYEDNRKLNKAVQIANEQLALARQALELRQQPENALTKEVMNLRAQVNKLTAQVDELQQQNAMLKANPSPLNPNPPEAQQLSNAYARLSKEYQAALLEIQYLRGRGGPDTAQPHSSAHPPQRPQSHHGVLPSPQASSPAAAISGPRISGVNDQQSGLQTVRNMPHPNSAAPPSLYTTNQPMLSSKGAPSHGPGIISARGGLRDTRQGSFHQTLSPSGNVNTLLPVPNMASSNSPLQLTPQAITTKDNNPPPYVGQPSPLVTQTARSQTVPPNRTEPRLSSYDIAYQSSIQSSSVPTTPIASTFVQHAQHLQPRVGPAAPDSSIQQLPDTSNAEPQHRPPLALSVQPTSYPTIVLPKGGIVESPTQMFPQTPLQPVSGPTIQTSQIQSPSSARLSPSTTLLPMAQDVQSPPDVDIPSSRQTSVVPTVPPEFETPILSTASPTRVDQPPTERTNQQMIQDTAMSVHEEPEQASINNGLDDEGSAEQNVEEEEETEDEDDSMEVDADGLRPIPYVLSLMFENVGAEGRVCRFCLSRFRSGAIEEKPTPFINEEDSVLVQHCQEQHPNGWAKVRDPSSDI